MAIIKVTANEMYNLFESERKNALNRYNAYYKQYGKGDSNLTAQRKKCEFVQDLLASVPQNTVLVVENCRGDGVIRDFALANAGSVVECLVKYHLTKATEIAKQWDTASKDFRNGCVDWEIKASLGAKFLATPSDKECTLLVNLDGVSLIRKADVLKIVNKQNRLPARGLYGKRSMLTEFLNGAFGFDAVDCDE